MTISFDLDGAHPEHAVLIEFTLRTLQARYPWVLLQSVSLYEPEDGDTSIGATLPGGQIVLNAYWFAGDPDRLRDAAGRDNLVEAGGTVIGWHGLMVREPEHVLHHEFGHVVAQAIPGEVLEPWQYERWLAATRDPMRAPSGYALGADPAEWLAEQFALCSLGMASPEERADMAALLDSAAPGPDGSSGAQRRSMC